MSSQAIRNIINNNIRRVISEVKNLVLQEGEKKIIELKDKLLTPEEITKILTADINKDSCSLDGKEKFKERVKNLSETITDIYTLAQSGQKTLQDLEDKIGTISTKIELPTPGPVEKIKTITDAIKKLTDILQYVIMASPAILASQTSVAGAGAVSGTVIVNTSNGVNLSKVKILEYSNLFSALPLLLDNYISKANVVFDNITKIKSQIGEIIDEIDKLKAFIIYLELDFIDKCNAFKATSTLSPTTDPPKPIPYPTLADIIALSEELYGNILEDLINSGDDKAIKRTYELGAQFQRIKNTSVKVIDI
tara:strand:- start:4265 stop:5188 length:924 start_codon:yes stop_codon:yes gene_type:complete